MSAIGRTEFDRAWGEAVLRVVDFDYSGYVLGNYLDAQGEIDGNSPIDEQSEMSRVLGNVYTAGFVFETPASRSRR